MLTERKSESMHWTLLWLLHWLTMGLLIYFWPIPAVLSQTEESMALNDADQGGRSDGKPFFLSGSKKLGSREYKHEGFDADFLNLNKANERAINNPLKSKI